MRNLLFVSITSYLILCVGCNKTLTGVNGIAAPGNSNVLVKLVSIWSDSSKPATDSLITLYNYDQAGFIVSQQTAGQGGVYYYRDSKERITKIGTSPNTADSLFTYVYYKSDTSTQVLYTIFQSTAPSMPERDSTAYIYSNGQVVTTSLYATVADVTNLVNAQIYSYYNSANVLGLEVIAPGGILNIGYSFGYDNMVNPLYSADDARLPQEWGYILSPHNIVSQLNHYGNPPQMPDDEVTYTYTFNANGLPATRLQAGTALGQQTCLSKYYYK